MDLTQHCILCDNQEVDFKDGTTCKLTGKRPEFNKTCFKIELSEKFEDKIKKTHIDLENVKRTKTDTYGHVVIFSALSLAVVFSGFYLGKFIWDDGVISTVPLLIIGAGFGLLPFAIAPLNKYRTTLSLAQKRKQKLDEVLKLYRIDYEIDLEFEKEIHGAKQVNADLRINRRR